MEVECQGLAKDLHVRIAIDFQVQLAKIAADKEVGIETAKSIGQAMAAAKITLSPGEVKNVARKASDGLGSSVVAVVENLTGVEVHTEKLATIENALRESRKKKGSEE